MSRTNFKRKKHSKLGIILVTFVMVMLLVVMIAARNRLIPKKVELESRKDYLTEENKEEQDRREELLLFEKYTKTKGYIKELAKEKLGLVDEDEIIFRIEE